MRPVTPESSGVNDLFVGGVSEVCLADGIITKDSLTKLKVLWHFPIQSFSRTETHLSLPASFTEVRSQSALTVFLQTQLKSPVTNFMEIGSAALKLLHEYRREDGRTEGRSDLNMCFARLRKHLVIKYGLRLFINVCVYVCLSVCMSVCMCYVCMCVCTSILYVCNAQLTVLSLMMLYAYGKYFILTSATIISQLL
jgi:hypothetical protein